MTKCFLVSGSQVIFSGNYTKVKRTIFSRTEGRKFTCPKKMFQKIDKGDVVLVNEHNEVIKVFKR